MDRPPDGVWEENPEDPPTGHADEIHVEYNPSKQYCWNLTNMAYELVEKLKSKKADNMTQRFDESVRVTASNLQIDSSIVKTDLWLYFIALCLWVDSALQTYERDKLVYESPLFNELKLNENIHTNTDEHKTKLTQLGCECEFLRGNGSDFQQAYLRDLRTSINSISVDDGTFMNPLVQFRYSGVEDRVTAISNFTVRPCAVGVAVHLCKCVINEMFKRNEKQVPSKDNDEPVQNAIELSCVRSTEASKWLHVMCTQMPRNFRQERVGGGIRFIVTRRRALYLEYDRDAFCSTPTDPGLIHVDVFRDSVLAMHRSYCTAEEPIISQSTNPVQSKFPQWMQHSMLTRIDSILSNAIVYKPQPTHNQTTTNG